MSNVNYSGFNYSEGGSVTAIVFEDEEQASSLLHAVQDLEKQGLVDLEDAVVVVKDQKGKVKVTETKDTTVKTGTWSGGTVGLFVGLLAGGPIGGLAAGLLGGRLVGKMADVGVDQEFLEDLSNALEPGSSAAVFQVNHTSSPRAIRAVLSRYTGTIYSTSIDRSVAEELQRLLDE